MILYSIYTVKNLFYNNQLNNTSLALTFIFIKYTLNILLNENMTMSEFEFSRYIMWLFTTPLMLKMYCDTNNLKLNEINIQYHIIPVIINIFIYPYKNTTIYYYFLCISWLFLLFFIKTLYSKLNLMFTNIYLFIWTIFICINLMDILKITNNYNINLYYSYADTLSKIMTNIIVNDYYEKELAQVKNMDLQCIQFISYMIKQIKIYENNNLIITPECKNFITFATQRFLVKIPKNTVSLEQELLRKILPLKFDQQYITNSNENGKQYNMISILFADIVNYTELAQKYNDKIIFELLNNIYIKFDNIIKQYIHLQKIETIGDAYMVVGDIFRNSDNHKIVIKEILLFSFDIVNEIKTIKTPNNEALSIRVGINLGSVSVGILGNEIPRLCIVGNAVNMASRLQSTADANTIQFSRHIYEQLDDIHFDEDLEIVIKENIFLKNIGSVTTYNISPIIISKQNN
jgi:class 3 adenylate cyclase